MTKEITKTAAGTPIKKGILAGIDTRMYENDFLIKRS